MSNPNPKNQFVPGDARINRRGRKVGSFDQARKLAQKIANEETPNKEDVTRLENLFREWSNPRHPKSDKFVEYAVGKVPNPVEISGKDGEPIKTDDEGHNRAISKLADALGEIVSGAGTKQDGEVDTAE